MTANTVAGSGDLGSDFRSTAAAPITLSIDASLGIGYYGTITQANSTGAITPVGTGGLTAVNRDGYTKTSGIRAVMGFKIDSSTTLTIWGDGAP